MKELIKKWEKRVRHYEELMNDPMNTYNIVTVERLYSIIDTFNTCIDELKHVSASYHKTEKK